MSKVINKELKSSLNNFLKAFNERNEGAIVTVILPGGQKVSRIRRQRLPQRNLRPII